MIRDEDYKTYKVYPRNDKSEPVFVYALDGTSTEKIFFAAIDASKESELSSWKAFWDSTFEDRFDYIDFEETKLVVSHADNYLNI